ncbi:C-type lectin domain family 4 member M-like [Anticarsia gemmatalis]|uniref:C-type lectin domain family 4 member M-like n=1 Tax=Anticarsia gemmatalis TaxID=129554 RepID=UPI003F75C15D
MRFVSCFAFLSVIVYVQSETIDGGYIVNKDAGKAYKLMYQSKVWSKAVETCKREGATLAVPKTQEEFQFLQRLVRGMYYPKIVGTSFKHLVWLGINNLDDYRVWKNIEGENIEQNGFHQWAGQNGQGYSDNPAEPHCAGMDAANPGLRDWWCHRPQPYVCEKPAP